MLLGLVGDVVDESLELVDFGYELRLEGFVCALDFALHIVLVLCYGLLNSLSVLKMEFVDLVNLAGEFLSDLADALGQVVADALQFAANFVYQVLVGVQLVLVLLDHLPVLGLVLALQVQLPLVVRLHFLVGALLCCNVVAPLCEFLGQVFVHLARLQPKLVVHLRELHGRVVQRDQLLLGNLYALDRSRLV